LFESPLTFACFIVLFTLQILEIGFVAILFKIFLQKQGIQLYVITLGQGETDNTKQKIRITGSYK
jgi:hypothetical protein